MRNRDLCETCLPHMPRSAVTPRSTHHVQSQPAYSPPHLLYPISSLETPVFHLLWSTTKFHLSCPSSVLLCFKAISFQEGPCPRHTHHEGGCSLTPQHSLRPAPSCIPFSNHFPTAFPQHPTFHLLCIEQLPSSGAASVSNLSLAGTQSCQQGPTGDAATRTDAVSRAYEVMQIDLLFSSPPRVVRTDKNNALPKTLLLHVTSLQS